MPDFGGLRCPACGGELTLRTVFDGCHTKAARYSPYDNYKWGFLVLLDCTKCTRVYPVCRTPFATYISETTDAGGDGR